MTAADIRALAYRAYEAINTRNVVALEEVFAPHVIRHAARETGIESVKKAVASAFTSFPEKRFVVEDVLVKTIRPLFVSLFRASQRPPDSPCQPFWRSFVSKTGKWRKSGALEHERRTDA